ncbi:ABC transporter permease [Winogradskyella aquimaris]|jgi:ABC-type lipoprotein release transport system permease subunit|uniref:FtsX-like permease family protein n=1 Tax=Winogradskyella aquimaris TaxID=864074 RepID=A0ABU5EQ63_9FLAO|nr:FtsX-like permease family protein [Winogradskyella aquimaris]MDY2588492.1 FtsX-like permease family protein [Winogradskyella aquimaris]|tara:strand:- start:2014 stop:3216 length:1203 start_codon:yes stop_codon:yes gene_type:complete
MTTKLAWRNIWRNKTRTTVFLLAAFFGFAMALFTLNLMKSISQQRLDDAKNLQTSDLQIHKMGFQDDKDITLFIPNAENVIQKVKENANVDVVAKRISTNAVAASPENSIGCEIKGVEPTTEREISVVQDFLVEGSYLSTDMRMPILISKKTADKLKLKLKSKIIITLKNTQEEIVGGSFRVAGIFATPSTPFDENTVIVNYTDLQELGSISEPQEIAIKIKDPTKLIETQSGIQETLSAEYEVNNWKELLPELNAFDAFINMVGVLFTIIVILGLGFSLMNIMNMIVQERTHEIGMLRAIGQSKFKVFSMLLNEAGVLMMIGAVSGILFGYVLTLIASKVGVPISSGLDMLGIRPVMYPKLNPEIIIMVIVIAKILTVAIASIPAYRAMRIKPNAVLRD